MLHGLLHLFMDVAFYHIVVIPVVMSGRRTYFQVLIITLKNFWFLCLYCGMDSSIV